MLNAKVESDRVQQHALALEDGLAHGLVCIRGAPLEAGCRGWLAVPLLVAHADHGLEVARAACLDLIFDLTAQKEAGHGDLKPFIRLEA